MAIKRPTCVLYTDIIRPTCGHRTAYIRPSYNLAIYTWKIPYIFSTSRHHMTYLWPLNDLYTTYIRPSCGHYLAIEQPTYIHYTACILPLYGTLLLRKIFHAIFHVYCLLRKSSPATCILREVTYFYLCVNQCSI